MSRSSPETVAFFSHSASTAGAERAMVYAIRAARDAGLRPVVFLPCDGPLEAELASLGVETRRYENVRQCDLIPEWWTAGQLHHVWEGFGDRVTAIAAELEALTARLVHVNTVYPVEAVFAAARLGLPTLWHPHELFLRDFHYWFLGTPLFAVLMGQLCDAVIAVSGACRSELLPYVPDSRLVLIHEPVDWESLQAPRPVPEDLRAERQQARVVLACVGSIDRRKAQTDLLAALDLLPAEIQARCHTWVVGSPTTEEDGRRFEQQLAALAPGVRVHTLGQRTDMAAVLQAADVLVHPAINDPFPLAVLEAMACGKPVIAARGGGVVECVEEGISGRLVPISDPAALARAIADVVSDEAGLARMGAAARQSARRFDVEVFSREVLALLQRGLALEPDFAARRRLAQTFQEQARFLGRLAQQAEQGRSSTAAIGGQLRRTLRGALRRWRGA